MNAEQFDYSSRHGAGLLGRCASAAILGARGYVVRFGVIEVRRSRLHGNPIYSVRSVGMVNGHAVAEGGFKMTAVKNKNPGRHTGKGAAGALVRKGATRKEAPDRKSNGSTPAKQADDELVEILPPLSNIPSTPSGRAPTVLPTFDADAVEIGELYRAGRGSFIAAAEDLLEAGRRLAAKKASLSHGQWLPWLRANAEALGFTDDSTAQRLMKIASKCRARRGI